MNYAAQLTNVVFKKYQKPEMFIPTGVDTKMCKYRITFIDESFVDVVMTTNQRNYTHRATYAHLVKHIGGLGYVNAATEWCAIRADLLDAKLAVPIGEYFYSSVDKLPYRWLKSYRFQVFFKNAWQDADSIDFDFPC